MPVGCTGKKKKKNKRKSKDRGICTHPDPRRLSQTSESARSRYRCEQGWQCLCFWAGPQACSAEANICSLTCGYIVNRYEKDVSFHSRRLFFYTSPPPLILPFPPLFSSLLFLPLSSLFITHTFPFLYITVYSLPSVSFLFFFSSLLLYCLSFIIIIIIFFPPNSCSSTTSYSAPSSVPYDIIGPPPRLYSGCVSFPLSLTPALTRPSCWSIIENIIYYYYYYLLFSSCLPSTLQRKCPGVSDLWVDAGFIFIIYQNRRTKSRRKD